MVKAINLIILLLIPLLPFILIYIIHALTKKKQMKYIICAVSILVCILIPVAAFYVPVSIALPEPDQLMVTIHTNDQYYKVVNPERIKEIKELVEKQMFIRSAAKTLGGIPPVPSDKYINIFFEGKDTPFSQLISIRMDSAQNSYLEKDSQLYNILNKENFKRDIINFVSHATL